MSNSPAGTTTPPEAPWWSAPGRDNPKSSGPQSALLQVTYTTSARGSAEAQADIPLELHSINNLSTHFDTEITLEKSPFFPFPYCFTALTQLWQEGEERGCDAERARSLIGILSLPAN